MTTHKTKNENVYDLIRSVSISRDSDKVNSRVINVHNSSSDVFHIDTSDYGFDDLILPIKIENELSEIISEYKYQDVFKNLNLFPTNKILLEGSPGCGKTMIAYVLSNLLKRELKVVNLSKIVSPHLGETAGNLSHIFNKYNSKEHILFIDEFDILGRLRGDNNNDHNEMKRIVNSLLQLIDYFPSEGFLIFATNDVEIIDKALIRRMDRVINIPMPNLSNIKKFLSYKLKLYGVDSTDIDYGDIAKIFKGFSYANIDREIRNKLKSYIISEKKKGKKKIKITGKVFLH